MFRCLLLVLVAASTVFDLSGGRLRVAAASSLSFAGREIAREFEDFSGREVSLSLGASGTFYAQITAGAPFDVFLSADLSYPRKLASAGLIVPGSLRAYAQGTLALWVRPGSAADAREFRVSDLTGPWLRRLAIPNPALAPYGIAARQALEAAGLWKGLQDRIVMGESVTQSAHMARSGAAEVAIVAATLRSSDALASGRWIEFPKELYDPIQHGLVILKQGDVVGARAFVDWLMSEPGQAVLADCGLLPAGGSLP